jgi:hypothetical protein
MTTYWVSQAKHWCEYCRIFIGGSQQSIAFHENGKKHKEIVELSLKDMRKRGREKRIDREEEAKEMAKLERAAMKDYLAHDAPGGIPPPRRAVVPEDRAARLAELEARISQDRMARASQAAGGGVPLPPGWRAATNPDGKPYYVHDATGKMQWDVPVDGGSSGGDGLPAGWRAETNPDGKEYYVHDETGQLQWERPGGGSGGAASSSVDAAAGDGTSSAAAPPTRAGWQISWTEQNVPYYYHAEKGVTQWEVPAEWSAEDADEPAPQPAGDDAAGGDGGGADGGGADGGGADGAGADGGGADGGGADGAGADGGGADGGADGGGADGSGADGGGATSSGAADAAQSSGAAMSSAVLPAAGEEDAAGAEDVDGTDTNTGLGAWTVVEEPSMPQGGWEYDAPREKRPRVAWAVNKAQEAEEEEEDRVEDVQVRFAVSDEMQEAVARSEAAEAAAAAASEAVAPAPVFAKRKVGSAKAAVRRKPSSL